MALKPKLNPQGLNANDALQDSVVIHAINLERLKASEVKKIVALLEDVELDIIKKIEKIDPTGVGTTYRARRLAKLIEGVRGTIKNGYFLLNRENKASLQDIAKSASQATANSINKVLRVPLGAVVPSASNLKSLVGNIMVQGDVIKSYWDGQSKTLQNNFQRQMRMGIASGESVDRLIQRVRGTREARFSDGLMNTNRRQAEALVRSSVSAVNNESAIQTISANQDIMNGYQWLATLDTRTSDICKARSGLVWDLDFQPVGHSIPWQAPPAHFNCRSTIIGVLKPWKDFSNKPLPNIPNKTYKEALKERYIARGIEGELLTKALKNTQSSMDGYVAGDINFEEWLSKKSVKMQKDILGEGKWELWKNKKIGFVDLINQSNQPRTLQELKELVESGKTSVLRKKKRKKGTNVNDPSIMAVAVQKIKTDELILRAKEKIKNKEPLSKAEKDAWDTLDDDLRTSFLLRFT